MGAKERVSAAGMAIASVLRFHYVHLGSLTWCCRTSEEELV